MKILVKKMTSFGILKVQMIVGAIVMVAAMIMPFVGIATTDPSLLQNPYIWGVLIIGMVMFGLFAYFLFIRPYFTYQKLPDVLAETDGEFLYIHGKKEGKIPLSELAGSSTFVNFPFLFSNEFIGVLLTYLISEKYGDLDLDVPGYGSYKMKFVSNVKESADELISFINKSINND